MSKVIITEDMKVCFDKFMELKKEAELIPHMIQNLASIVQNPGVELAEQDLLEWGKGYDRVHSVLRETQYGLFQNTKDILESLGWPKSDAE